MNVYTCCFTGHRQIPPHAREELIAVLDRRIAALADVGFTEFRVGGALGFDTLAAQRVLAAREQRPTCQLHLILPCRNQPHHWHSNDEECYRDILSRADRVTYVQETYTKGCMHLRNRALVEGSDLCLAFCYESTGGSAYTCRYALQRGVRLINLVNEMESMQKQ